MTDYYNDEVYEDEINEVNCEEQQEDEPVKYIRLEYQMDEIMEHIYEDVIVPYLDCISQQEILHELDEFTVGRFINFFKDNSPYYRYILSKIDN